MTSPRTDPRTDPGAERRTERRARRTGGGAGTLLARLPETGLRLAAPLWLTGWAVMRAGGNRGANLGWAVAHSIWIIAFGLFGAASVALFRRAVAGGHRRAAARGALAVALVGTVAMVGQMGCDLTVGLLSADRAEMSRRYDSLFAVPGVQPVLFQVGPALLFVGLLALTVLARLAHRLSVTALVLVVVGVAALALGKPLPGWWRAVEGLGAVCLWAALTARPPADAATATGATGATATGATR